jgi:hypothetical protein
MTRSDLGWADEFGFDGDFESNGMLDVPGGTYRMRVSARDRDSGRDGEFEERPVDAYLIELWSKPTELDAIMWVRSDDAQYWHREVGTRR